MLERYRLDLRVMHIAGYNPLLTSVGNASYYFSPYMHCWGWATWRRVAQQYDYKISDWPLFKGQGLMHTVFDTPLQRRYFEKIFDLYHQGGCNNWDQQWMYMIVSRAGLCINPCVNLVQNIGFGDGSSFAQNLWSYHAHRTTAPIQLPLRHPEFALPYPGIRRRILRKASGLWWPRMLAVHLAKPFIPWMMKFGNFFYRHRRL